MTEIVELEQSWTLEEQIGGGGFGKVYRAISGATVAAVKLVPKTEGAQREMLFVDLNGVPNVVPVLDSGETADAWAIVMPLAETTLRAELEQADGTMPVADVVQVASDILHALVALNGRVVHRDLKPENVLRIDGVWCLADFGISRYAEASTAPDTQKFAMSPPYAAPERWQNERATEATDVYSLGVMLFELVMGERPFPGPTREDFREQHLHSDPPEPRGVPDALAGLIQECIYKSPASRPRPENLLARVARLESAAPTPGIAVLEAANREAVTRQSEREREASEARTASERRNALASDGRRALESIGGSLRAAILAAASAARANGGEHFDWGITLGDAVLSFSAPTEVPEGAVENFDVVVNAQVNLRIPATDYGFEGRSHSLWFCDAQQEGQYAWFETAFKVMALMREEATQEPFALPPGSDEVKQALSSGMGTREVAWPFTRLDLGDLDDFVNRWANWLAEAAKGELRRNQNAAGGRGSWRRG